MGLDSRIEVHGDFSETQLIKAKKKYELRFVKKDNYGNLNESYVKYPEFIEKEFGVEIHNGQRYFGDSYTRGYWPEIYAILKFCLYEFPNGKVYYGSDQDELSGYQDENEFLVTKEKMEYLWDLFLSDEGRSYMEMAHAFNNSQKQKETTTQEEK